MRRGVKVGAVIGVLASVITILIGLGILPPRARSHTPGGRRSGSPLANSRTPGTSRSQSETASIEAGDGQNGQHDPTPVIHQERPLDDTAPPVTGSWQYNAGKVTIAGKLFEGYGTVGSFATFDVRGWDRFACVVGITDDCEPNVTSDVAIEIDGRAAMQQRLRSGAKPVPVNLPLVGRQTLTLRNVRTVFANGTPYGSDYVAFAEPRLTRGKGAIAQPNTR
jgi:hypothetical protein